MSANSSPSEALPVVPAPRARTASSWLPQSRLQRRIVIGVVVAILWEIAYRIIDWRPISFPAPSHLYYAIAGLLGGASGHGVLNALIASSSRLVLAAGFAFVVRATTWPKFLVWAGIIGAWEGAFQLVQWKPWVFPAPSHVLEALNVLVVPKNGYPLYTALAVSGSRLALGFSIAIVAGGLLGVALWRFKRLDEILGGLLLGFQTLPSVCWVPLAVLTFGLDETSIQFVLVMGSTFAVSIALRDGLGVIPPIYLRAGQMLGARSYRLYRYVLLPASLPALASSLRQGFSFAWRSLMGAELIFMIEKKGVGYLLHQGREFADVAQVVGMMLVMISVGVVADRALFANVERRVHARFGFAAR